MARSHHCVGAELRQLASASARAACARRPGRARVETLGVEVEEELPRLRLPAPRAVPRDDAVRRRAKTLRRVSGPIAELPAQRTQSACRCGAAARAARAARASCAAAPGRGSRSAAGRARRAAARRAPRGRTAAGGRAAGRRCARPARCRTCDSASARPRPGTLLLLAAACARRARRAARGAASRVLGRAPGAAPRGSPSRARLCFSASMRSITLAAAWPVCRRSPPPRPRPCGRPPPAAARASDRGTARARTRRRRAAR